jgi:adenylate cyclase
VTEQRVQRRLAAILAADVVGYSKLMELDEEATYAEFERLKRELIEPSLSRHEGRLIKTTGDGALVEFASPLAALRCTLEIQNHLASDGSPFSLRIGINLGDVIVGQDGELYGDGINIAVRLEGIAGPGGILISEKVYSEVEGKLDVGFEDLGEQLLKNISKPVRAYAVRAGASSALSDRLSVGPPLPDKPSIAVLRFHNLSGDPEQEYLADGLVEDIITALSRFKGLFVIARNTSFTYKGKPFDIKKVGRELGVRYVLEGSVRRAGARLRITGQLIDGVSGAHLWAERFDGALDDIFELQDRVTQRVVGAIAPELDRAEIERASRRPISNVDALTEYYRGLPHVHFPTSPERNDVALGHFRNAMTLDPSFAPAYGAAASCFWWRRANRWPCDRAEDDAELLHFAERVKELGTDDALTLSSIGFGLFHNGVDYDLGIEMVDRAIRSNPNFAPAYVARGSLRVWDGESDTAIADFEQSMRLSPRDPFIFAAMSGLAFGHYNAGRYKDAAAWAERAVRAFPYFFSGLRTAIMCYVGAGRLEDAQRVMADCIRLNPAWRLSTLDWNGVHAPEVRRKMLDAFIKAGLPA